MLSLIFYLHTLNRHCILGNTNCVKIMKRKEKKKVCALFQRNLIKTNKLDRSDKMIYAVSSCINMKTLPDSMAQRNDLTSQMVAKTLNNYP